MPNKKENATIAIPDEAIEKRIYFIREQKVMLDGDLSNLYEVPTHRLNEQVTRNRSRFPEDFMFRLTLHEVDSLRSQNAISKSSRGGRRYRPRAFTEQGVAMLSSVLRGERAVHVNVAIMRAFVRLRRLTLDNEELARKFAAMARKYDAQFKVVFVAIRELMKPASSSKRRFGFQSSRGLPLLKCRSVLQETTGQSRGSECSSLFLRHPGSRIRHGRPAD